MKSQAKKLYLLIFLALFAPAVIAAAPINVLKTNIVLGAKNSEFNTLKFASPITLITVSPKAPLVGEVQYAENNTAALLRFDEGQFEKEKKMIEFQIMVETQDYGLIPLNVSLHKDKKARSIAITKRKEQPKPVVSRHEKPASNAFLPVLQTWLNAENKPGNQKVTLKDFTRIKASEKANLYYQMRSGRTIKLKHLGGFEGFVNGDTVYLDKFLIQGWPKDKNLDPAYLEQPGMRLITVDRTHAYILSSDVRGGR